MTGWLVRLGFGAAALALVFYALAPAGSAFGQLGRGVDALGRAPGGGVTLPHIAGFQTAAEALTGRQGEGRGAGGAAPSRASVMQRLFSDRADPAARASLQDVAARRKGKEDGRPEVPRYVPGGRQPAR